MTTYRKRGTEVDAFQWTEDAFWPVQMPKWTQELIALDKIRVRGIRGFEQILIDPPLGRGNPLVANLGDWIVRNARGEVFPMTAEKFAETYETVNEDDETGYLRVSGTP